MYWRSVNMSYFLPLSDDWKTSSLRGTRTFVIIYPQNRHTLTLTALPLRPHYKGDFRRSNLLVNCHPPEAVTGLAIILPTGCTFTRAADWRECEQIIMMASSTDDAEEIAAFLSAWLTRREERSVCHILGWLGERRSTTFFCLNWAWKTLCLEYKACIVSQRWCLSITSANINFPDSRHIILSNETLKRLYCQRHFKGTKCYQFRERLDKTIWWSCWGGWISSKGGRGVILQGSEGDKSPAGRPSRLVAVGNSLANYKPSPLSGWRHAAAKFSRAVVPYGILYLTSYFPSESSFDKIVLHPSAYFKGGEKRQPLFLIEALRLHNIVLLWCSFHIPCSFLEK